MNKIKIVMVLTVAASMTCLTAVAQSAEYDAEVRAGIGVSDNIARTTVDEIEETIATVGFDFAVTEDSRRLDLRIRSNVDYLDYLDDTFDSEWVGGLDGFANIRLVEGYLDWIISETFGQQRVDPYSAAQPGNRENVSFFTTGPTLRLLPASRNSIVLDARYSRVRYEVRPYNNERMLAALSIGRDTSRDARVSVNLSGERTEFEDDAQTPDFDEYRAFVRFEKVGVRNSLSVDLGYTEVELAGETGDGFLGTIDWTREVSANGLFRLTGGTRYSDQGNIFRLYQELTNDFRETADSASAPGPFRNNFFAVGYGLDHTRYSVDLSLDWSEEDYLEDDSLDREIFHARARAQREVSRTIFIGAGVRMRIIDSSISKDDELTLFLNAGYRITPGLSVSLDYVNFRRDSSASVGDTVENRLFLRLAYAPAWTR